MSDILDGLDIIILDDDESVCEITEYIIRRFYTWGDVHGFTNQDEAIEFCMNRPYGIAIFVVDFYIGGETGFKFLDSIKGKYKAVHEDAIIITGAADNDIVELCLTNDVNYLLEKPIQKFALQLAVRAIATKYLRFASIMQEDPEFVSWVNSISKRYFSQLPRLSKKIAKE